MRKAFSAFLFLSLASCSTTSQTQSQIVIDTPSESPIITVAKTSATSNESFIDALVVAPNLYVHYVEDGAADASVLGFYVDYKGNPTSPIAQEVKDIVALRDKAIPLLIEHLDDTRPTSATVSQGGYLTDKPIRVPVGHICLDILINIGDNSLINGESYGGFGDEIKDGYYFRPDDYKTNGEVFEVRPIVRIVKANWQKAYRSGKVKYKYVVAWK